MGCQSEGLPAAAFTLAFDIDKDLRRPCCGNDFTKCLEQGPLALAIVAPSLTLGEQRWRGAQIESRGIQTLLDLRPAERH